MNDITCVISTKNRYNTTLPLTLQAVANQTYLPKYLLIYDDGDHKDLRNDSTYVQLFSLLQHKGINWSVIFGERKGQVLNHIKSIKDSKTEWIWRLDDDNAPEPNVLENLVRHIAGGVGAIGGLIIDPSKVRKLLEIASNKIEDIFLGLNEQWFLHDDKSIKEVDHLYSSFIYRKSIAKYPTNLSVIGHREETILTYQMKQYGYKVLIDPSVTTWHLCNAQGGIRSGNSDTQNKNGLHDEEIFKKKLVEWNVNPNKYSFVGLDSGIGDHYVFKSLLPEYLKSKESNKIVLAVCYPEVFKDVQDIKVISIEDLKTLFGNIDNFNIYKWMWDNNWKTSMRDAFAEMYKIKASKKINFNGSGEYIIISPYSQHPNHAKSYPYWNQLVKQLTALNKRVIQIGRKDEPKIDGVYSFLGDLPFKDIEHLVSDSHFWISSDNFLQHLVNNMSNPIKGVVIWGTSDPKLFGYNYNLNLLRSRLNLRKDQFDIWNVNRNDSWFLSPDEIVKSIISDFNI